MEKWRLDIDNSDLSRLYENYLSQIDYISTLYSVVLSADLKIRAGDFLNANDEIPLSDDFSRGFTTIKNNQDMIKCSESKNLEKINHYQTVISLVSNYENFINSLIDYFGVSTSIIKNASPTSYGEVIESPILKKIQALHDELKIESNVIGSHELKYLYKIIRARNTITHSQGVASNTDLILLEHWIKGGVISFTTNQIDDFIHFFVMPTRSMLINMGAK